MYEAQALQTESNRPTLPVTIQSGMPHITLQLGTVLNDSESPCIRCVLDTAAALYTGNYYFFAAIAKRYPHCVAKIYLPEDYSHIYLSGFVQDNHTLSPLIYLWHSSFTYHTSPEMEAQPFLSSPPDPK